MQSTCKFGKNQYLFNCFLTIKDPRVGGRCTYSLLSILVIVLCGLVCGCDGWKAMELLAKTRKRWLSRWIDLSEGVPSHQTLARVFSLIDPIEFERCLHEWVGGICALFTDDVIAIDGKTTRGSSHKRSNKKATHLINAYSSRLATVLGSTVTPDKSNEIKGIPLLLKTLNIKDKVITIDAMGTQKGIAKLIRLKEAHYLLALKKNHGRLYKKVNTLFNKADELDYKAMVYKEKESNDYDHSRIEHRKYTLLPAMYLPTYSHQWKDLSAYIRVESERHLPTGEVEMATRYYITSMHYKNYRKIPEAIRQHWQIENGLHYKLDVGMNEDQCPIYRGYADRNLSIMRKIVLKLLTDEKTNTDGIALKRMRAALSVQYTKKVVGF
ncbi:Transposase IS4 family protein [Legionella cherrii]|uniref:Transposase IS4 family protein n=2 Tax=Legionella cherrii TaxID=28084 RepID=A0ABY6T3I1_9GAMM|nr:Transposase IS4 family protein [Legionella cherrii]